MGKSPYEQPFSADYKLRLAKLTLVPIAWELSCKIMKWIAIIVLNLEKVEFWWTWVINLMKLIINKINYLLYDISFFALQTHFVTFLGT